MTATIHPLPQSKYANLFADFITAFSNIRTKIHLAMNNNVKEVEINTDNPGSYVNLHNKNIDALVKHLRSYNSREYNTLKKFNDFILMMNHHLALLGIANTEDVKLAVYGEDEIQVKFKALIAPSDEFRKGLNETINSSLTSLHERLRVQVKQLKQENGQAIDKINKERHEEMAELHRLTSEDPSIETVGLAYVNKKFDKRIDDLIGTNAADLANFEKLLADMRAVMDSRQVNYKHDE
jgi:hypothetical protein